MSSSTSSTVNVLFVCLGNICRSPTAESVFQHYLQRQQLDEVIHVDSCGTGDWHIGHAPDPRAVEAAQRRGFDPSALRARQVRQGDFDEFHYVMAMDKQNLKDLDAMKPTSFGGELELFLRYAGIDERHEVPDPFYGGEEGFEHVLDLIEDASDRLIRKIVAQHAIQVAQ